MNYFDQNDLTTCPLFCGVDRATLSALFSELRPDRQAYPRGTRILRQGQQIWQAAIVQQGSLLLEHSTADGRRAILVDEICPGETLCMGYITAPGQPLYYDVRVQTDCLLLWMDCGRLLPLINRLCPRVLANLVALLNERTVWLSLKNAVMALGTTRDRIAVYLMSCSRKAQSESFFIPLNREDLAAFLGVERTALSKELSQMQKAGFFTYRKNHFTR